MPRKRKSAQAAGSGAPDDDRNGVVRRALFQELMEGSVNTTVDPAACIPFTCIREIVRSGVERLKFIFSKKGGIVAGSHNPIVVPLSDRLLQERTRTE